MLCPKRTTSKPLYSFLRYRVISWRSSTIFLQPSSSQKNPRSVLSRTERPCPLWSLAHTTNPLTCQIQRKFFIPLSVFGGAVNNLDDCLDVCSLVRPPKVTMNSLPVSHCQIQFTLYHHIHSRFIKIVLYSKWKRSLLSYTLS